ncbi:MAG: protease pro-enzyme activation domain-containing protein, partial [Acidimicrobiales bacterium]
MRRDRLRRIRARVAVGAAASLLVFGAAATAEPPASAAAGVAAGVGSGAGAGAGAGTPATAAVGAGAVGADQVRSTALVAVGQSLPLPRTAARLGAVSGSAKLRLDIILRPRDPAALAAFATAVSTPGSPLYRHYLKRGRFGSEFGPTQATVHAVEAELGRLGLHPGPVTTNRLVIPVTATAGEVARAFATPIDRYRLAGGRIAYGNAAAPLLPLAIAPAVEGVLGLQSIYSSQPVGLVRAQGHVTALGHGHVVTGGPQPCSAAVTAGASVGAFTADQLASAYGFGGLYSAGDLGAGTTVAVYELEPNLPSDIAAYQSCYGTSASVSYTEVDGGAGVGAGSGEAALDIEDVIGLAPQAHIDVYQGPNNSTGPYDTYNSIISGDTAQVIVTSWGACESSQGNAAIVAENTLFEQAAAQGQSVVAASGDAGSEDCSSATLAVDDPSSQPFVTGVGGTSITALGPPPVQKVWNDKASGGGATGGGISQVWTMPSYQSGAPASLDVVNPNSSGTPCSAAAGSYCREVPDVSANADPYSGYVFYYKGSWGGVGGTSAASPLWAALFALADGDSACRATGAVGFANPALYRIAGGPGYSEAFADITVGNNDYSGTNGGLFPAEPGYSMATGLGTPIAADATGNGLVAQLCGAAPLSVSTSALPDATVATPYVDTLVASGGTKPYTWSLVAGGLPAGLHLSPATGVISGTPTAATASSFTVQVTDAASASAKVSLSITVKRPVLLVLPPSTPRIGVATAANQAATVRWTEPANTGKVPVTSYRVLPFVGAVPEVSLARTVPGSAASSALIGSLRDGTTYTFTVTATSLAGESFPSAHSNAVTPAAPPAAVAITTLKSGSGYFVASSDGAVAAFGPAPKGYSLNGKTLASPVVGIAADPATSGYWLVTERGKVYSFQAPSRGSLNPKRLASPGVGRAADPATSGYWLVTERGRVYGFHAPNRGSLNGKTLAS